MPSVVSLGARFYNKLPKKYRILYRSVKYKEPACGGEEIVIEISLVVH